jgi:Trp operon repressor
VEVDQNLEIATITGGKNSINVTSFAVKQKLNERIEALHHPRDRADLQSESAKP